MVRNRCSQPLRHAAALSLVALLVLSSVTPGSGSAPDPATPVVVISELLPRPDLKDNQTEYIELWNRGGAPVELEGWKVQDRNGATFTFPPWRLDPDARVVLWSGTGAVDTPEGPRWRGNHVWAQAGDTATLRNATGAVVDWMAYGDGRVHAPPPGFSNASMPDAPGLGVALLLVDGAWIEGEPVPGRAPGSDGGSVAFQVEDVPPQVGFLEVPSRARAGAPFNVSFQVEEPNGDDVVWVLRSHSGVLAQGDEAGVHTVQVTPPTGASSWRLDLSATDPAGNVAAAEAVVQVREQDLVVDLPSGGQVAFPSLRPGDAGVASLHAFHVENVGDVPREPRFDISTFRSGSHHVPVEGNLRVGVRLSGEDGAPMQWVEYVGPYTALPELSPGQAWEVVLELLEVPAPLPAGQYGTTFTVVEGAP